MFKVPRVDLTLPTGTVCSVLSDNSADKTEEPVAPAALSEPTLATTQRYKKDPFFSLCYLVSISCLCFAG